MEDIDLNINNWLYDWIKFYCEAYHKREALCDVRQDKGDPLYVGAGKLRIDFLREMTFMLFLEEFTQQESSEMGCSKMLGLHEG